MITDDYKLFPGCTIAARPGPGRPARRGRFVGWEDEGNSGAGGWAQVIFEGEHQVTVIPEDRICVGLAYKADESTAP